MGVKATNYKKHLSSDILAGITVSLILIPQALAYAQLAGLPPHYGLYASIFPPILAAIFGSSRQLITGPVAVLSLMTASAVSEYYTPGSSDYVSLSILLAFCLGAFQLVLSLIKLGSAVSLLSHPVIYGFTNAAALIIASTQLAKFFNVTVPTYNHHYQTVYAVIQKASSDLDTQVLFLGIWTITAILVLKRINNKFPAVLTVILLATFYSWLSGYTGPVVGNVSENLPIPSIPSINLQQLIELFPTIIIMAIVSFTQTISVAQSIAVKTKNRIDPNKELFGQGIANLIGSIFQSYPTSGSFSSTAVNFQAGGKTTISSVITGVIALLTLFFFTKLIYYLPQVILAAVIVIYVGSLFEIKKLALIWNTSRHDAIAALITFIVTLYYAPHLDKGLAVGVLFSLGYYIYKNFHPRVVFLSMYKDGWFHDAKIFKLKRCDNIAVIRFDGQLFFANSSYVENIILNDLVKNPQISDVIICANGLNELDSTGEHMLYSLWKRLNKNGKNLYFSSLKSQISETLMRSGLYEKVGDNHFYPTLNEAIKNVLNYVEKNRMHLDLQNCPLRIYIKKDTETKECLNYDYKYAPFYKKAILKAMTFSTDRNL